MLWLHSLRHLRDAVPLIAEYVEVGREVRQFMEFSPVSFAHDDRPDFNWQGGAGC